MLKNLTQTERKTFVIHLIYSALDGILYGAMYLNEFIILKSLQGKDYHVGILFSIPTGILIFSMLFNEIIKRTPNKKRFLRTNAIITRLPLLLVFFFPDNAESIQPIHQYIFFVILFIYYLSHPLLLPVINLFLKNSYSHENFGKLYSYATSISKIVMLVSTFITGWLLDINHYYFRYIYLFLGIAGIIAVFILSEIKYKDTYTPAKLSIKQTIIESLNRMKNILITNKPFLHFQAAFFLYGIAFNATVGVISLLLNDVLQLNYTSLAMYKNTYNLLNIALLPVFGHFIGKTDPRRFGIYTFLSLAMFLLFLLLSYYFDQNTTIWNIKIYYMLVIAYTFYGIFAAFMGLLWFIGSTYFGKNHEAGDYQAIHVTLTGIRGLFAPLMGIGLYRLIGYTGVFATGIALLFAAMAIMAVSKRRYNLG